MANQLLDIIVSCIDFVENYSFMEQNEIQTQHWYNFQITNLMHLTWRINPNFMHGNDKKTKVITEYHFYILDNCKHDNLFVQHCFRCHWNLFNCPLNISSGVIDVHLNSNVCEHGFMWQDT
jgi:hypothetical protein